MYLYTHVLCECVCDDNQTVVHSELVQRERESARVSVSVFVWKSSRTQFVYVGWGGDVIRISGMPFLSFHLCLSLASFLHVPLSLCSLLSCLAFPVLSGVPSFSRSLLSLTIPSSILTLSRRVSPSLFGEIFVSILSLSGDVGRDSLYLPPSSISVTSVDSLSESIFGNEYETLATAYNRTREKERERTKERETEILSQVLDKSERPSEREREGEMDTTESKKEKEKEGEPTWIAVDKYHK